MSTQNIASRFDEIYDSTNKAVLAFITAKCNRTADISDIFQETYMELYSLLIKRGATYVTHEKALVLKIAKRKLFKHYSMSERLKVFVPMTSTDENGDENNLSELEADSFLTEDFAVNNVLLDSAKDFLRSKPEDVQKVFYLTYEVGLTISEVAQTMSMSESNVKNKLYRTLKELRDLLE